MKLRNKKTGEIGYPYFQNWKEITCVIVDENAKQIAEYTSLAELNEEWQDYEDDNLSKIIEWIDKGLEDEILPISVNDFVEKLKAWKRLKNTYHIRFVLDFVKNTISFTYRLDGTLNSAVNEERIVFEDMVTIFGGEE